MDERFMLEEVNLTDLEVLEEALAYSCPTGTICGFNGGPCGGAYCGW